jgi:hypothetical protein
MPKLSKAAKDHLVIALASNPVGLEVIKAIEEGDEVLSGEGPPASDLGENGNLYIDTLNGDLYKKFNDAWSLQATDDTEQPVGIKDPSLVSLSVDDSQRMLTVAPIGPSYVCYVKGKRITITDTKTIVWPNTPGLHFFFIDANGSLNAIQSFNESLIVENTFLSIVYWDVAAQKHIYFANERHGIKMSPLTHMYLHRTKGAAFDNGCKLVNFSVDGAGSLPAHAQFTANSGTIWDEDIKISMPAQAIIPVLYRSGPTQWKRKEPNPFPIVIAGEEGYTGVRLPYNRFNGSTWDLAEVDNNKFVLVHIFATNDIEYPFMAIQGQAQYDTKTAARDGAINEIKNLAALPLAEFCPVGSVIYQTNTAYTNAPKAAIVSTSTGENYEDHRTEILRPGSLA